MKVPFAIALALSAVCASAATAQKPAVAGTYLIDFDAQVQASDDGNAQVTGRGKARLSLEVRGDSVFGVWQTTDVTPPRPARKLRGVFEDGAVKLVSEPTEAVVNDNGEEKRTMITQIFIVTVADDAISGTITADGATGPMASIVRKLEGKRETGR